MDGSPCLRRGRRSRSLCSRQSREHTQVLVVLTFPLHPIVNGACGCGNPECKRAGKHPAESWKHIDPNRPELSPSTDCGVGIATGARSGVFVVDLDVKNGIDGIANFAALGECPPTRTVRTPSGGLHPYFKHPGFPVKTSASALAPGIDVRGDGGYVVAPGSPHVNGGRYELAADLPIADAPAWLLNHPGLRHANTETAQPATEAEARFASIPRDWRVNRAKAYLATQSPAIEGHGGDAHTWTLLTRAVHDHGLTDAAMIADAFVEWNARCEPPWGGNDWTHKIDSVLHHSTVPWSTTMPMEYRLYRDPDTNIEIPISERDAALEAIRAACAKIKPTGEVVTFGGIKFKHGHYDQILAPIEYQVDRLFGVGDVSMLVAHGNSLKTWLAMSLAQAIASGRPWLGQYGVKRGRVGFIDFESGEYEVMRRLKLLQTSDALVGDRLLRSSMPAVSFEKWETWEDLALARLDQVIIDSFAAATSAKENEKEAAKLLEFAGRFAETFGPGVLVIHHERKSSGGDPRESVRGSTAIYAACDRIYGFSAPETMPNEAIRTTMTPDIKHGAGNRAPNVTVELTNSGLNWIAPKAEEKKSPAQRIHDDVISYLSLRPMGVQSGILHAAIEGDTKVVKKVIANMIPGELATMKEGKATIFVLSPNVRIVGVI